MRINLIYLILIFFLMSCGEETTKPSDFNAPSDLSLTLIDGTTIRVRWIDNSSYETGFVLQRRSGNQSFAEIDTLSSDTEAYLDENLNVNTIYYYRVAAIIKNEYSEWSNVRTLQTHSDISDMSFGEDDKLEVMTWNIQHFPKNGDTTINYAAEIIKALQVDIIAMQEMGIESNFDELLQKVNEIDGDHEWIGEWRYSDSYGNNLAIIYNSDVLENVEIYNIQNNDWYCFPRAPLVLEADFAGEHFYLIDNHLKAMGDADSEERRRLACIKLDQYVQDYLSNENVIILGDLNDLLTDQENDNVFWNFIENSQSYFFVDMEIANGDNEYWSYPSWPSHLDHILITNELFDEFSNNGSVVSTILIDHYMDGGFSEYDTYISDHRPVALKLVME
ncbi:MAG: endonuclease/exonuclease/phosphatase family protein [Candidatus Cloacimonetes bacterium]|nr:endonuclease/exonuclease/phosphatase family protein [Candidatus Cloacimonadota bacterium]